MDKKLLTEHLDIISSTAKEIERNITIMEICGGHTNTIMRYGIRELLPRNIRLISGPGCPVCVSSQYDIDCMIELAHKGIPIATYGDMLKVPGSNYSLEDAKAKNGRVFEVYSTTEVLKLKDVFPDIVFFGVGFETTAPMTAFLLENDVAVYSVHKLVPPVLEVLLQGEIKIDGFLDPGHVSTIIGEKAYQSLKIPQVISGFTPERILRSIRFLLELIRDERKETLNGYPEAVSFEGNRMAQKSLDNNFFIEDSRWRGLGTLPKSGLGVRNNRLNAKLKYAQIIKNVPPEKQTGCRCGEIIRGLIEPVECPLYKKACTPDSPKGACMVSEEGSCSISYRYGK